MPRSGPEDILRDHEDFLGFIGGLQNVPIRRAMKI